MSEITHKPITTYEEWVTDTARRCLDRMITEGGTGLRAAIWEGGNVLMQLRDKWEEAKKVKCQRKVSSRISKPTRRKRTKS